MAVEAAGGGGMAVEAAEVQWLNVTMAGSNVSNSSAAGCPAVSPSERALLTALSFLLEGVMQILLSSLGVLGNAASIFLLSRPEMRSSFNQVY
jgi:hypothetical protein